MKMDVWLEAFDVPVGELERAPNKTLKFTYASNAVDTMRISMSMPVRIASYGDAECRGYFDNLVFEGPQMDRVIESYKIDRDDTGAILHFLGADCPGAISITPAGSGPAKHPGIFPEDYDLLTEAQMHRIVQSLHFYKRLPEDKHDPSPLAGVQGKIAVVYRDGQYFVPKPGNRAPTTHILKVSPLGDSMLTRYEVALLEMARASGIPTTGLSEQIFPVGASTINAILLDRFDRFVEGNRISRIHTEDFCQALGLAPTLKYERASLSPGRRFSASAVGMLALNATAPGPFIQRFLDQTLFNLLVGNSDNHGKNSSLLHKGLGTELAPLYDVVPVFMDRNVTHRFAFDIGAAKYAEDLTQDDLVKLMRDLGYKRSKLDKPLVDKLTRLARTIAVEAQKPGRKALGDALSEKMTVVAEALNLNLEVPRRDYYGRITRDE